MAAQPPIGTASPPVSAAPAIRGAAAGTGAALEVHRVPAPGRVVPAAERVWPAAAPSALYDIVSGPFRPPRILGVSRLAVYLEVEGPHGATAIALLARDTARLPNGPALVGTQSVGPFADVASATSVRIGRCSAVSDGPTGPRTVHAGRWRCPPRPRAPRRHHPPAATAEAARALGIDHTSGTGLALGMPAGAKAVLRGQGTASGRKPPADPARPRPARARHHRSPIPGSPP
ncbi:hypothetical protein GCM10027570_24100 [Streptomonospora sediminis]